MNGYVAWVVVAILGLIAVTGASNEQQDTGDNRDGAVRGYPDGLDARRLTRSLDGAGGAVRPAGGVPDADGGLDTGGDVPPPPGPEVEPAVPVEPVQEPPVVAVLTNDIERLVCAQPWPCLEALDVMWCESGGRPDAWLEWTSTPTVGDGVAGLFQIATHANGVRQWIGWDLYDPAQNVAAALILWEGNGGAWRPDFACSPW